MFLNDLQFYKLLTIINKVLGGYMQQKEFFSSSSRNINVTKQIFNFQAKKYQFLKTKRF